MMSYDVGDYLRLLEYAEDDDDIDFNVLLVGDDTTLDGGEQIDAVIDTMAGLTKVLTKYRRSQSEGDIADVLERLVDVETAINQMKEYLEFTQKELMGMKNNSD